MLLSTRNAARHSSTASTRTCWIVRLYFITAFLCAETAGILCRNNIWHYYIRGGGGLSFFVEMDIRGMQKAGRGGALGFLGRCSLDDDTVTMVDFVLDDLGGPAGEVFDVSVHFAVLPLYLDGFVALGLALALQ